MTDILPVNNNIVDVETAKAEWETYQKLCRELLNDNDYQAYEQNGEIKRFPKKSAWMKLGRAFNVDTEIIDKEFIRGKNGETREAYYCIRATLPNGRTVESDGSCSRHEKGKANATSHTIRSTAKTRATCRAISELIGAGEVSDEELDPSFDNGRKITPEEKVLIEAEFTTADQLPNVNMFVQEIIDSLKEKRIPVTKKEIIKTSWEEVQDNNITKELHHEVVSWCKVNCPDDPKEVME